MQIEQSTFSVLFYLIACALHGEKPDENKLSETDTASLYYAAKKHSLSALVYTALQDTDIFNRADPAIISLWKESKDKAIRNSLLLDAERNKILAQLEKKHIWYMPLKGCVLKALYPREGMREMVDNDILFDRKYRKEVKNVFACNGYTAAVYARGVHDVYVKKPIYNFEMHTALFSDSLYPELSNYYKSIQEKLAADNDIAFGRHMKNEDLYIYITAHAYKHYLRSGTGLRSIVDCYVMNSRLRNKMDWAYVSEQLQQLGITEFEQSCRSLAYHLFDKPELKDVSCFPCDEQELLSNVIHAGTYGTVENQVKNILKSYRDDGRTPERKAKFKYYMKRLFPGRKWCRERYPFFYRFPAALPLLWLYRMFRALTSKRKKAVYEIKAVQNAKQ